MRRTSFAALDCSIAQTLEVVGEWWTLLILRDAFLGVRRFEEFQRDLGIARNILTDRLNRLVEHGILERRPYQTQPPRSEYRLTEKGLDLYPVLLSLMRWGDRWAAGTAGPPLTLTHRDCGHEGLPVMSCAHCGEAVAARDMSFERRSPIQRRAPERRAPASRA
jgi:DNA-binding HxlR family transcriptional regulator